MKQVSLPPEFSFYLLEWFRENARKLPWRETRDPYAIWVSEIMLQQTRVAAVIEYYRRFLSVLPSVKALAAVDEDTLLKLWQGLGYYSRARNLQRAAQMICDELDGHFPNTFHSLLSLPGVGEYTAGAVASIAFGEVVPAVDGNVLRVLARICGDFRDISLQPSKRYFHDLLLNIIPSYNPGGFNQAMMELGATVCLPNGAPLCDRCPVRSFCTAHQQNLTDSLPVRAPKKPRRTEERTVFLLFYNGKIALRRRPDHGLLAGLWEYPNELSSLKNPLALWGLSPMNDTFAGTGKHIFTHIEWQMTARQIFLTDDTLPQGWVWADAKDLTRRYSIPSAFHCFEHFVVQALASCGPEPPILFSRRNHEEDDT